MQSKVCGLTRGDNLTTIAGLRPSYVGFIFAPSPRRADKALLDVSIPLGVKRVGVFVNPKWDDVLSCQGRLDAIQLHGSESPELASRIRAAGFEVLKAVRIDGRMPSDELRRYVGAVDLILLDTAGPAPGGNGRKFDWKLLSVYDAEIPFLLSGGIVPEDVSEIRALRHPQLAGVDINSGFESVVGIKDEKLIRHFLDELRRDS